MSTKAERGTKRTCQNPECGSRFYDLNRDPIVCPICQTVLQLATPAEAASAAEEDELPAIEGEDETEAAEEDETFLEPEEEDGSDMENIIGGPVAETDEPDR